MDHQILYGIFILFIISLIVRIVPSFLKNRINVQTIQNIEKHLPVSVFITMATYLFVTEYDKQPIPALIAFLIILAMICFNLKNIIVIVILSSASYIILKMYY